MIAPEIGTIWKYPVKTRGGKQLILLPAQARILSVGLDPNGELSLWALVNRNEERRESRQIGVYATGGFAPQPLSVQYEAAKFIGTVLLGPLVLHLFDYGVAEEIDTHESAIRVEETKP